MWSYRMAFLFFCSFHTCAFKSSRHSDCLDLARKSWVVSIIIFITEKALRSLFVKNWTQILQSHNVAILFISSSRLSEPVEIHEFIKGRTFLRIVMSHSLKSIFKCVG
jgi:hypothetical protein